MVRKLLSQRFLYKVLIGIRTMFPSTLKRLLNSILAIVKKYIFEFEGLIVTLILLAIFLVLWETFRDAGVMLEPILVSQEIADMGYTPDIMARRLKDSTNVYHTDEVTNIKETILRYRYHELDIVLPEVGISIKSVSSYLRDLFGRNITSVSGEMLYHEAKDQISFRLRLNSEQIFGVFENFNEMGIITLLNNAGYKLTKRVNPYVLALYHYKNDEEKKALEIVNYIFKNLDKDKIDYVRAINLKGVIHYYNDQYEEAISEYERAIDFNSSYAASYNNWGGVLAKKGDYHGAIEKFKEAKKADPDNASTYVYWCGALAKKENPDWKAAVNKCRKALKLDPKNAFAHFNWGIALVSKKEPDWQGAIEQYMEALKLDPKNAFAHLNWGVALVSEREPDWQGAIEQFREALKLDPNNISARIYWGFALMGKREPDWQGAIEQFREAVKLDPNYVSARNYWGIALMSKREPDWQGAIEQFREALKLDQNNALAYFNWGKVLMSKRDWSGVIEKYKEVIKLKPMSDIAYYRMFIAFINIGKSDIAAKMQNCMNNIGDSKMRLKCSELVLSL